MVVTYICKWTLNFLLHHLLQSHSAPPPTASFPPPSPPHSKSLTSTPSPACPLSHPLLRTSAGGSKCLIDRTGTSYFLARWQEITSVNLSFYGILENLPAACLWLEERPHNSPLLVFATLESKTSKTSNVRLRVANETKIRLRISVLHAAGFLVFVFWQ